MRQLSEDDLNLRGATDDELDRAWDLWFDLAQSTNDADPEYTHGVFIGIGRHQTAGNTTAVPAKAGAKHLAPRDAKPVEGDPDAGGS